MRSDQRPRSNGGLLVVLCFCAGTTLGAIKEEPIPELRPPRKELQVEEKKPGRSLLWVLLPAAGAVAGLAVALFSRREPPPPVPPAVRAREALGVLREKGDAPAVMRVFREYVEGALGVPGRAATRGEILASLADRAGWSEGLAERVRRLIEPVERGMFAPGAVPPGAAEAADEALVLVAQIEALREGGRAP